MQYSSLHNHTDYSNLKLIDSINTVEGLIDYAYELGLKGLAITEHDTLTGHIRALNYYQKKIEKILKEKEIDGSGLSFEEKIEAADFRLVLGNEIYITREGLTAETHKQGEKFYHCILLAKDEIGYRQIRELSSRAWMRGYMRMIMRTPTYLSDIDEIVGAEPGHLVCTTACIGGYCGVMFQNYRETKDESYLRNIDNYILSMKEMFGFDFYIELQPSRMEDQIEYNKYMLENYRGLVKFTIATDSHYLKKDERVLHKVFLQSKEDSANREVDAFYASAYMMSAAEIEEYVSDYIEIEELEKMFENTIAITNECKWYTMDHPQIVPKIDYEWEERDDNLVWRLQDFVDECGGESKYPHLYRYLTTSPAADEVCGEADSYLIHLIAEGFWSNKIKPEEKYIARLDNELYHIHGISENMNQPLSDYFNTMSKIMDIVWSDGDSIVGPGRGSGAGCLINYLVGITQIDPLTQQLEMPFWRFMDISRPGLPDIDFDTEAMKRLRIFNSVRRYFNSINSEVINVCTIGTLKTKSAIRTAARGLDMDDAVTNYIVSLVPTERGQDWSLEDCYYGNGEDREPIKNFKTQMDTYPQLWQVVQRIAGLVTNLSVHASGVLIINGKVTEHNSVMKTSRNVLVTCWDLHDSESAGGLKYDFLTVQALDKIRTCLNLLLENKEIEWMGNLKKTYEAYLLPANLDYSSLDMWDLMCSGKIAECFQYDTMMGAKALRNIQPSSLRDLAAGNSIMRLMSDKAGGESPLDTFVKYKNNIKAWYNEMMMAGLNEEEMDIMEKYLKPVYGVAGSQELAMLLTMDPNVANFSVAEANTLRKGIAKKKPELIEKIRQLFYSKGAECGTRTELLDYIWNVQIHRQVGYSFSDLHTVAYSTIALQEMNLAYYYPMIYWNCACLSVDSNAVNEEDYEELVKEDMIALTEEEDEKKVSKVSYDKVVMAISKFRNEVQILLPDINRAKLGFIPVIEENSIVYGLKGLTRIGDDLIDNIIKRRPYTSLLDFVEKMRDGNKTLISKDKVVNLIKAGCFDRLENKPRYQIMKDYLDYLVPRKTRLTLQNIMMLVRNNLLPEDMNYEKGFCIVHNEIKKEKMGNYLLLDSEDDIYYAWYCKWIGQEPEYIDGHWCVKESEWLARYEKIKNKLRVWIKANEKELIDKLYEIEYSAEWDKYAKGDELQWELDSLNFYYSGHPLENAKIPGEIRRLTDIEEGEIDGYWNIDGNTIPKMKLSTICGTVLIADDKKHLVTLSTPDGVIKCNVYKAQYAKYNKEIEDSEGNVISASFFKKGNHIMITGILRDEVFIPKVYKNLKIKPIRRIILNDNNEFVCFEDKD